MGWVPSLAFAATETLIVDVPDPGAGMGLGRNFTVERLADKVIAESNPPDTVVVMVVVPELP